MLSLPSRFALPCAVLIWVLPSLFVATPAVAQPVDVNASPKERLAKTTTHVIEADTFAGAFWGLKIVNLRTGEELHSRNAKKTFVPASNAKLFTTAASLDQLGPEYRYRTAVYADGPVKEGILQGNLIVRGAGDPTIGGYEQQDNPTRIFQEWADSLRERGISGVEGAVIGDPTRFDNTPYGHGWTWKDVSSGYGAPLGGLVFNENMVDLEITGRSVGEPASIQWTPNTDYVTVRNRSRTIPRSVEDDNEYERLLGTDIIHVRARVHPGATEDPSVAIHNPTRFFSHTLRATLLEEGIGVDGSAADLRDVPINPSYHADSVRVVASFTSSPLSDIVRTLNVESRNVYAEQLVRTLAVEVPPDTGEDHPPGSSALGLAAVQTTLVRAGIDTSRIQLADGSGLSRQNLASPRALVRVLQHMWLHSDPEVSSAFVQSLPKGGEDGTLEYRFRGSSPARGNVRAKTGTLSNVSALSGYVTSSAGTPLAFSLLCNHHHADDDAVRAAQDKIVNALARLPL